MCVLIFIQTMSMTFVNALHILVCINNISLIAVWSIFSHLIPLVSLLGKGLFCSKKPPKTEDSENLLTHHQRKLVDLAKHHLFADEDCHKFAIHLSFDDKAYIRPGTSGIFTY